MTEGDHVPRVITFAGLGRLYLSNSPGRETAAVTLLQQFNCTFAAACMPPWLCAAVASAAAAASGYSSFIVSVCGTRSLKCRSKVSQMIIKEAMQEEEEEESKNQQQRN